MICQTIAKCGTSKHLVMQVMFPMSTANGLPGRSENAFRASPTAGSFGNHCMNSLPLRNTENHHASKMLNVSTDGHAVGRGTSRW
jgi:hypothetical protein